MHQGWHTTVDDSSIIDRMHGEPPRAYSVWEQVKTELSSSGSRILWIINLTLIASGLILHDWFWVALGTASSLFFGREAYRIISSMRNGSLHTVRCDEMEFKARVKDTDVWHGTVELDGKPNIAPVICEQCIGIFDQDGNVELLVLVAPGDDEFCSLVGFRSGNDS